MRFVAAALLVLVATPALAQEARTPHAPPPEGFYRNINGVYDLLARPYAMSDIQRAKAQRLPPQLLEQLATPVPPPCEPAPTANAPAQKPPGPSPCPATR